LWFRKSETYRQSLPKRGWRKQIVRLAFDPLKLPEKQTRCIPVTKKLFGKTELVDGGPQGNVSVALLIVG